MRRQTGLPAPAQRPDAGWAGGLEPPPAPRRELTQEQGNKTSSSQSQTPLHGKEHSDGADRMVGTALPPNCVPTPSNGPCRCPTHPLSFPPSCPTFPQQGQLLCQSPYKPAQLSAPLFRNLPPKPWLRSDLPSPGTPVPTPAQPLGPTDRVEAPNLGASSLPPSLPPGSEASSGSPSPCQQDPHVPQTDPTRKWKPTHSLASLLSRKETGLRTRLLFHRATCRPVLSFQGLPPAQV